MQDLSKFLNPVIDRQPGVPGATVTWDGNAIQLHEVNESTNMQQCLKDLTLLIEYLNQSLPGTLTKPLSRRLLPLLSTSLISRRLSPAVPVSFDGNNEFEELTKDVTTFRDRLRGLGWEGDVDLTDWIENIPQVWLSKRRERCLEAVRNIMLRGPSSLRKVERAETERISSDEGALIANGEHGIASSPSKAEEGTSSSERNATDDSDMSAWGFDATADQKEENVQDETQDAEEAWGITRESEEETGDLQEHADTVGAAQKTNEIEPPKSPSTREMTLRETYGISSGPGAILEVIEKLLHDAMQLRSMSVTIPESVRAPADRVLGLILAVLRSHQPLEDSYPLQPWCSRCTAL